MIVSIIAALVIYVQLSGPVVNDPSLVATKPAKGDAGTWPWSQIAIENAHPTPHF